jgi:hypothetical protein
VLDRSRRGGGRPPPALGGRSAPGTAPRHGGSGPAAAAGWCVLSSVGEGRVAQLMQRPPRARVKQLGRPPVRQPGPPAGRVQIEAGNGAGWPTATQKDRSAGPAGQQAGEQLGRPGMPEHPLDRATLAVRSSGRCCPARCAAARPLQPSILARLSLAPHLTGHERAWSSLVAGCGHVSPGWRRRARLTGEPSARDTASGVLPGPPSQLSLTTRDRAQPR